VVAAWRPSCGACGVRGGGQPSEVWRDCGLCGGVGVGVGVDAWRGRLLRARTRRATCARAWHVHVRPIDVRCALYVLFYATHVLAA
jgi:hypothetical protein